MGFGLANDSRYEKRGGHSQRHRSRKEVGKANLVTWCDEWEEANRTFQKSLHWGRRGSEWDIASKRTCEVWGKVLFVGLTGGYSGTCHIIIS